ncbi:hypothetical protein Ping_2520 [Psychromonas ingrahamii 37]|uniref:Peptidase M15A C-terminal domain-containing protein n=1 Tax=Psychromonas ingrahamii (strain DSM 17664 / CCUG 51855 / 37) TaxID=357804 RepID=A1SXM6_PSYIN|nr:hypothetical protein [Psychromonas ingrahamii]ABM04241.1 hypothetical protein Ping_2520 [Psychromonas ingrahamii 37]
MAEESQQALQQFSANILFPLEQKFHKINITYGFTSFELLKYIKKNSPGEISPERDQHAAHELNSRGNRICKRDGAACDIVVAGYENQMQLIAQYIITELPFDRLYFYGKNRPLHVSFGPLHKRYLYVKERDNNGKRNAGKGDKYRYHFGLLKYSPNSNKN